MKNPQFPIARKTGIVIQEVPDELLVYDLDTNKAHCLNQTAALIWKSCDGSRSVTDIAKHVESLAGGAVSDDFVWLAIDQLNENNLLDQALIADFNGLSRRDVIKKIGLGTMVAVPIIASLVAPSSALAAQSCLCLNIAECGTQPTCPQSACSGGACV